jgi:hypothetical protein
MLVRVSDPEAGKRALEAADLIATIDAGVLHVDVQPDQGERVTRALVAADLYPSELRPDEVDLETVFLELTKDEGLAS